MDDPARSGREPGDTGSRGSRVGHVSRRELDDIDEALRLAFELP